MALVAWLKGALRHGIKDDHVSPYHVFFYSFMLVGGLAAWIIPSFFAHTLPPDTDLKTGAFYPGGYDSPSFIVWLVLSTVCPLLVISSYWIPSHVDNSRFFSIMLRFAGDLGQFFALIGMDLSTFKILSDASLYRNVLFVGFIGFVFAMLMRDIFLIVASLRLAAKLDQAGGDDLAEGQG